MTIKPTASISEVLFSGGQKYKFSPREKIIIVGPNNSGKSQSLREIYAITDRANPSRLSVVKEIKLSKEGSVEDLRAFLEKNAIYDDGAYMYKDWRIDASRLDDWHGNNLSRGFSKGFIKIIDANERLNICQQQSSIGPGDHKGRPQHILYDDSSLMEKISFHFRAAFGKDIMIDYRGGSVIPIHVGEKPSSRLIDRVSDKYVAAVRANPLLSEQGDGMKSYAGILFETIVTDLDIILLDEPEAFLHPPQMRRLGETLSSQASGQLIVATHSSDILRGFLEGTRGNVRILRIQREGTVNSVFEAAPEIVAELWNNPELKYSNGLEGIFHEQTVICEDDSDCRLINAVADYIASCGSERWKDTAYIPTGGKHGVKKIAGALRRIGVPVKAVFDIDFLSDEVLVRQTVEAFGGSWSEIRNQWTDLDAAVRSGVPPKSADEIKAELVEIINNSLTGELPRAQIIQSMKQTARWSLVKQFGRSAIPSGHAQSMFDKLTSSLAGIGIYVIPVGEIENFCKDIGGHGPKYVNGLLTNVPLGDKRLEDLRNFVVSMHRGAHAPV